MTVATLARLLPDRLVRYLVRRHIGRKLAQLTPPVRVPGE